MATIGGLVESAYAQVIADVDLSGFTLPNDTLNVYQGFSDEEKAAPCVVVSASGVADEAPNLGVYRVRVAVAVIQMAADSDATASDNLTAKIFETVTGSNIKAQLTAKEAKLAVYDVIFVTSSDDTSGDAWTQTLEIEVIAVQAP